MPRKVAKAPGASSPTVPTTPTPPVPIDPKTLTYADLELAARDFVTTQDTPENAEAMAGLCRALERSTPGAWQREGHVLRCYKDHPIRLWYLVDTEDQGWQIKPTNFGLRICELLKSKLRDKKRSRKRQ